MKKKGGSILKKEKTLKWARESNAMRVVICCHAVELIDHTIHMCDYRWTMATRFGPIFGCWSKWKQGLKQAGTGVSTCAATWVNSWLERCALVLVEVMELEEMEVLLA